MTGSHSGDVGSGMFLAGNSVIHRLPAQVKIISALLFVFCVVATPRGAFWAFGAYALLLLGVAFVARVPLMWIARRSLIEVPFVILAVLLPFAGGEPQVEVLGMSLSEQGLLAAWNLLAKGTLGVVTSILLASTTPLRDLLVGLQQLRLPAVFTQIATLMIRYLAVILDQARRMRIARLSRGDDPRFLWQVGSFARSIGTLFLRSYERGERVYVSMVSRGYTGSLPMLDDRPVPRSSWAMASVLPIAAFSISVAAWLSH